MTVYAALAAARARLADVSDAPRLDAEWLLLGALKQTEPSWLAAHGEEALSAEALARFSAGLQRRQTGEPLAYILGEWDFYGRPFYVTPAVLVPRPSTEALVEAAISYIDTLMRRYGHERQIVVADIGTGSGCIGITLALALIPPNPPLSRGALSSAAHRSISLIATDISPAALAVAQRNAERHGVADRIEFLQGDMLTPLSGRPIDLIVSNPPYVPSKELAQAGRKPETAGLVFEPSVALDGGSDGLDYVWQIATAGVPAIVETVRGEIAMFNLPKK